MWLETHPARKGKKEKLGWSFFAEKSCKNPTEFTPFTDSAVKAFAYNAV